MAGDKCMKVVENQKEAIGYEHAFVRAKAIKGLIEVCSCVIIYCFLFYVLYFVLLVVAGDWWICLLSSRMVMLI